MSENLFVDFVDFDDFEKIVGELNFIWGGGDGPTFQENIPKSPCRVIKNGF